MNLLKTLAQVSSFTLLSRLLGFLRDILIAALFGAQAATDAFVVAFRLPNLLRRLFAEGAFSQAFVPVLTQTQTTESSARTKELADRVFTLLFVTVGAVTVAGVVGAEWLVRLVAPGFADEPERFSWAVAMTRLTFPYILFMALVAFSSALFNSQGYFRLPAATPIALNLAFIVILTIGWALDLLTPYWLAYSVLVGGVLQFLWHWVKLPSIGFAPRWNWCPSDPGVQRILALMGPAVLGVSAAQVSLLLNTLFASLLPTGSLSWLYYADRLMELPAGLFGAALGVILLPHLSKAIARKDEQQYQGLIDWGLRMTWLLTAPCALAFALIGEPITTLLFQRGAFTAGDAHATAQALAAYAVGLVPLIAVKILAPSFYARQNTRTPVKGAILTLVVTQALNLLFLLVFTWGHWALALALSLAAWGNAGYLLAVLLRQGHFRWQPGWARFLGQTGTALALLTLFLLLTHAWLQEATHAPWGYRVVALVSVTSGGALLYLLGLWVTGLRWNALKKPHHG
ncbi:murein biosynthesis integral membrane protein MurJ [Hydrogenophilus islandicus]